MRSLYIGGGTPTVLSPSQWEKLAKLLASYFDLSKLEEMTVEANPESLMREHLSFWKESGVTRVSLGIQSLRDHELLRLGRLHNAKTALSALDACLEAGFLTSCDIIFGIPGQSLRDWHETLRYLAERKVPHVSAYQLSIEPGSMWADVPASAPSDGYPFYRWTQFYLGHKGYLQYEISSFCVDSKWCFHNLGYWYGRDCIGLGPSAWGLLGGRRYRNVRDLDAYCRRLEAGKSVKEWTERLSDDAAASESAILALRTFWGLNLKMYEKKFGTKRASLLREQLDALPNHYLLRGRDGVALSPRGMRVGNAIWERLLPAF